MNISLYIKALAILVINIITIYNVFSQDTIVYKGFLSNGLLYRTIEMYPDSTFKHQLEYDLSWSEYGLYTIKENKVQFDYYIPFNYPISMSLIDSIALISLSYNTERFIFNNNHMVEIDRTGKKVKRIMDHSLDSRWGWIKRHQYKIKYFRE